MFKYVTDVSSLSQGIIKHYCANKKVAVDATLGNGYDTNFLSELFDKVYSFDIQKEAVDKYAANCPDNVELINDSHSELNSYINEKVDCVMYNLGFLPGGDKSITTKTKSTIESINAALDLLSCEGIITVAIYSGHEEGKNEKDAILELFKKLPKNKFAVMLHTFHNRNNNPPMLAVIEKK